MINILATLLFMTLPLTATIDVLGSVFELLPLDEISSHTNDQEPEIIEILKTREIEKRVPLYRKLIERVGVEKAQEALFRSGLPFNGDTHLLNHTSGDYLYETQGSGGIVHCKSYFLFSCYHGILIATIAEEGMHGLEDVMRICRKNGGEALAGQCAHAIGHGLLAWSGYAELPQAFKGCDIVSDSVENFPLLNCYDGVAMENLWAVHTDGETSPDRWVDKDDPFFPCNDRRIDEQWKKGCWLNQASVMYELFDGDISRVSKECTAVQNPEYQWACQNNLARQLHTEVGGSLEQAIQLCREAGVDWEYFCLTTVAEEEYILNGRTLPFEICASVPEDEKTTCYEHLQSVIYSFNMDTNSRLSECDRILEEPHRKQCRNAQFR